eukprot:CAMPEP_0198573212 /NCGR_PEP_ID=MMETSP1462-20131121/112887_1 /TAXON_ID=1333877 /ORGANISM="Brandtodinium nutriculum, Strain RCC3387" /LENGTH=145 /DNA_ID=CAMNT_0044304383 /DNA_START=75 /DNA_END=513 /DNA_ORIENTATION=+
MWDIKRQRRSAPVPRARVAPVTRGGLTEELENPRMAERHAMHGASGDTSRQAAAAFRCATHPSHLKLAAQGLDANESEDAGWHSALSSSLCTSPPKRATSCCINAWSPEVRKRRTVRNDEVCTKEARLQKLYRSHVATWALQKAS